MLTKKEILKDSDEYGNSKNKSTVNSLHHYDLGNGITIPIETQTGLCNISHFLACLYEEDKKQEHRVKEWCRLKQTKRLLKEFETRHENEIVSVYVNGEVKRLPVVARKMTLNKHNKAIRIAWLHKELAPFYIQWVNVSDKVLDFAAAVFDTKMSFLRDKSAKAYKKFAPLLQRINLIEGNEFTIIEAKFSNKLSKLVFGFNDDGVNQWNEATDDQLLERIILLAKIETVIKMQKMTEWDQLSAYMNELGKEKWLYW